MDPLASNNTASTPEVEDMFADTDVGVVPAVHELLPENIALAPTITTLKTSPKFWLWRFRKLLVVLASAVVSAAAIIALLYWLKPWSNTAGSIPTPTDTNTMPVNTTRPANGTPPPPTNQPVVTNSTVDTDHDGLSDQEELLYNTNPKKKDTDEDGLSDREEVRVYTTDPRNPDTDGDGYNDGEEVTHFYDPNSSDPTKRLFDLPK